jgi:hypothetical protein
VGEFGLRDLKCFCVATVLERRQRTSDIEDVMTSASASIAALMRRKRRRSPVLSPIILQDQRV